MIIGSWFLNHSENVAIIRNRLRVRSVDSIAAYFSFNPLFVESYFRKRDPIFVAFLVFETETDAR